MSQATLDEELYTSVISTDAVAEEEEIPTITQCFLVEDENGNADILDATEFMAEAAKAKSDPKKAEELKPPELTELIKFVAGSRQGTEIRKRSDGLKGLREVEPPYSPELMLYFLKVDEVVHRCISVKATDAVARGWSLHPRKEQSLTPQSGDEVADSDKLLEGASAEQREIIDFIDTCNEEVGFVGTLHKAAMDCEAIGWAAIEVIRGLDMKIKKIAHVPATRVKPLMGWGGFVEECSDGKKRFYQNFGDKILSLKTNPLTKEVSKYDPLTDGDLTSSSASWNLVDPITGLPTTDFFTAANEILWVVKPHPATVYYGVTDSLPAAGHILANVHMREFLRQFFEHNTVPRYAIIIKGANLDPTVKQAILEYFSSHVKGRAHKTMIIPLPVGRSNVEVKFEKLELNTNESWFMEPSKEASHSTRLAHGVSAAVAGFNDSASLGSGKGLAQTEVYKERTVVPLQALWAASVNRLFRLGLGATKLTFELSPLDVKDREAENRVLTAMLDRMVITINEFRAITKVGQPFVGGDRPFMKIGNSILFLDEIQGMKSGPIGVQPAAPGKGADQPLAKGGDNRSAIPVKKGSGNGADNILDPSLEKN